MFQSIVCDDLLLCHLLLVSYMVLIGFVYVGDCCSFVGSYTWIVVFQVLLCRFAWFHRLFWHDTHIYTDIWGI